MKILERLPVVRHTYYHTVQHIHDSSPFLQLTVTERTRPFRTKTDRSCHVEQAAVDRLMHTIHGAVPPLKQSTAIPLWYGMVPYHNVNSIVLTRLLQTLISGIIHFKNYTIPFECGVFL